jgi:hypothetical protein
MRPILPARRHSPRPPARPAPAPPASDESVKVELWDVVDKGIRPQGEFAGVAGAGLAARGRRAQIAGHSVR